MAELMFVGVVVLVLYFVLRGGASLFSGIGGRRYRAYRQLANRYRGRYENRGFNEPPTVSFTYNGANVRVGLAPVVPGQNVGPRTRVVARFARGLPFRLELAPTSRALPSQPPRGTRPIRIGENDFDRAFNVQANDAEMARDFLSPAVRYALSGLGRFAPPGGILVSINPERLLVQVDRNLGQNVEALSNAVREALVIYDGLIQGVAGRLSEGVAIVEIGAPALEENGPPICKVCGDLIQPGPRTFCATCRVPYHRDCWDFIGSCSVFGCSGKTGTHATVESYAPPRPTASQSGNAVLRPALFPYPPLLKQFLDQNDWPSERREPDEGTYRGGPQAKQLTDGQEETFIAQKALLPTAREYYQTYSMASPGRKELDQLDLDRALVLGEFDRRTGSALVLDYSRDSQNPPVMWFTGVDSERPAQWIPCARDFDHFAAIIGLKQPLEPGLVKKDQNQG